MDKKEKLSCLVDWVSFTIQDSSYNVELIISDILMLNQEYFSNLPHGNFGYKKQVAFDNIRIFYDGAENMGINVQMSGTGCRLYESKIEGSILELFKRVLNSGGHFTRLDLAVDDFVKLLPLTVMEKKLKKGHLVSLYRKNQIIRDGLNSDGTECGKTLYIGRKCSENFIRIYDKLKEMTSKGIDVGDLKHWVRLEIQWRGDGANEVAKMCVSKSPGITISEIGCGFVKGILRFVEPSDSDINKSRWETSQFWLDFLSEFEKIKLSKKPEIKTLEQTEIHLKHQYAPIFALLFHKAEGDLNYFVDICNEGEKRWKSRHREALKTLQHT